MQMRSCVLLPPSAQHHQWTDTAKGKGHKGTLRILFHTSTANSVFFAKAGGGEGEEDRVIKQGGKYYRNLQKTWVLLCGRFAKNGQQCSEEKRLQ